MNINRLVIPMNYFTNLFALALLLSCSGYGNALTPQETACRRNFLQTFVTTSVAMMTANSSPLAANAEYGKDAKMTFPDVVQGLSDRANKQCLVESLGNRECLVYMEDAEKFLYKGADVNVLIARLQTITSALDQIPPLIESKKWNAVTGILTGPMGQLSSTLTQVSALATNPAVAKDKAQIVKQDLFAMGTATSNKQGDAVLKYQKKAIDDLGVFLNSL